MAILEALLVLSGVSQEATCPLSEAAAASVVNRADDLRVRGSYAEARGLLEGARACVPVTHPFYPALANNLAQIYKITGPKREVEPLLKAALLAWRGTDHYPKALVNLADWYQTRGDMRRAESLFREAVANYPEVPVYRNDLGALLHKRRRFEEAEASYRRALELYQVTGLRGAAQTWGNLGLLLAERKRDGEAIEVFQEMMRFTPLPVEEQAHATCLEVYAILLRRRPDPVAAERVAAAAMRYRVRSAFRHSGL